MAGDDWFRPTENPHWRPVAPKLIAVRNPGADVVVGIVAGYSSHEIVLIGKINPLNVPVTEETEVKEC